MTLQFDSPPVPFTLPSFAKINWSLEILGRRADGYHEIRTLLQTISLHDQLQFETRTDSQIVLACSDSTIPVDDGNLVVRAAEALRQITGINRGATIHLDKRIPAGGGLGGGSSNAAVALLGLAYLWKIEIDAAELARIGAALGADVPFFFFGGRALAGGTGTDVRPVSGGSLTHLLVVPPCVSIATAEAYKAINAPALTTSESASILSISRAAADLEASRLCALRNDFEVAIFQLEPEIERTKRALISAGASTSLLAGSGSSVFGIFESKQDQERAAEELEAEAGWRVFPAVTVSRSEYLKAFGSVGSRLSR